MVEGGRAVDLLYLIDRLEEMISEGRRMPLGGGLVLDRRRILDLIDQLRVAVPAAVREAQELLSRREELLQAAEQQARDVVSRAETRASELVAQHELVLQAEERVRTLMDEARRRSEGLIREAESQVARRLDEVRLTAEAQMAEADRYALELLQRLEGQLGTFVGSIRAAIETISSSPPIELPESRGMDEDGDERFDRD